VGFLKQSQMFPARPTDLQQQVIMFKASILITYQVPLWSALLMCFVWLNPIKVIAIKLQCKIIRRWPTFRLELVHLKLEPDFFI